MNLRPPACKADALPTELPALLYALPLTVHHSSVKGILGTLRGQRADDNGPLSTRYHAVDTRGRQGETATVTRRFGISDFEPSAPRLEHHGQLTTGNKG